MSGAESSKQLLVPPPHRVNWERARSTRSGSAAYFLLEAILESDIPHRQIDNVKELVDLLCGVDDQASGALKLPSLAQSLWVGVELELAEVGGSFGCPTTLVNASSHPSRLQLPAAFGPNKP